VYRPIAGWSVVIAGQTYRATRYQELTAYQRLWGAVSEVEASSEGELWVLCDAQTRLAERLTVAEAISPQRELCAPSADEAARS
jgi:hypothetical protein